MSELVPIIFENGETIYVEAAGSVTAPAASGIIEASALSPAEKAVEAAQEISGLIQVFCRRTANSFRELETAVQPTKASVEFGINISVEGNVYVVKGAAEASVKIKAEWDFHEQLQ